MALTHNNRLNNSKFFASIVDSNQSRKFYILNSQLSILSTVLTLLISGGLELSQRAWAESMILLSQQVVETRTQKKAAAERFFKQGQHEYRKNAFQRSLTSLETALEIFQEIEDREGEMNCLYNLGITYLSLDQYKKATDFFEQSLEIAREMGNHKVESDSLNKLGEAHHRQGQYEQAISFYLQSLNIYREIGDRQGEVDSLGNLGAAYNSFGQDEQAIDFLQQTLALTRDIGDRKGEAAALGNLGIAYYWLGQYERAIDFHLQHLTIAREIGERQGEGNSLGNLGLVYQSLGQYERAIDFHLQHLAITREMGDRQIEVAALYNLGLAYDSLGQYERAIDFHLQSLDIKREISDLQGEVYSLGILGLAYQQLSQYGQAIDFHQQNLTLAREVSNRQEESYALQSLGSTYLSLGQYKQATDFFQQSLSIAREISDRRGESYALRSLGSAYLNLGQYEQAIDFFQQSLSIAREIGNRRSEGYSLGSFGNAYRILNQYEQAADLLQQSLSITREIGDLRNEGYSLNNIGLIDANQENYTEAITKTQQALTLFRNTQDRSGEGLALSNLGRYLTQLNQPQLAITFYKASVDVRESIRGDLKELDPALQQSYTDTIADDYRALADLLLQQNRIPEAQRVLDLLKVQELDDYFQDIQRSSTTQTGIAKRQSEQDILNLYIDIVLAAEQLAQLEKLEQRTTQQQQRYNELKAKEKQLSNQFFDFIDLPEVQTALKSLRQSSQGTLNPEEFKQLQNNLANLPTRSALLYTLILGDRLELVLVRPDTGALRVPVAVDSATLNRTIAEFGRALSTPNSDPKPLAQQLYRWLIAPLEPALATAEVETLLYAPDGALRYIPLAALHDGEDSNTGQWLAERFSITNITAASLTDFDSTPSNDVRLFAGACAECSFTFDVNGSSYPFQDLPATETEVKALAELVQQQAKGGSNSRGDRNHDSKVVLNQAFSPESLDDNLGRFNIIHLATHAAFVSGSPRDSFIVFGDGSQVSLRDIRRNWTLDEQELIVLSACETAVGQLSELSPEEIDENTLGNGAEILGLGFQIQNSGAQSVMASLWQVSDSGTQELMNEFYQALLREGLTKTEALQRAQRSLITRQQVAGEGERAALLAIADSTPSSGTTDLSHPYYWAPFILIGNGL